MKKIALLISVMPVFFYATIDFVQAGISGNRQIKQQKRIHQGLKSGELTKQEALRLEREQRRIQKTKQKALKDGKLTQKERFRLEHQQDKANKHIYRLKHNKKNN
ncbi:MAG: hypothetical protein SWH54_15660 [Thermodesulfobacteriota bacterium]|nr:hypothetical protein [Thermodesulfobacteriota bacterium]